VQQQPQYQYGADPYAAYPQYQQPQQQPPPPVKKKSYWWVIFPILGGVIILTVLIVYFAVVYSASTTPLYGTGNAALNMPPIGGNNSTRAYEAPSLFRF
jgi:hypothetical protein